MADTTQVEVRTYHGSLSLGYLIPEFPGQTHIFFWREIEALREFGARVTVFSTRRPLASQQVHFFAEDAGKTTEYLFPPRLLRLAGTMFVAGISRPRSLMHSLQLVFSLQAESWRRRCNLLGYMVLGAYLARVCAIRDISHLHVHSAADSALIALFAHMIGGISFSVVLHGDIEDYGTDHAKKLAGAEFVVAITERLATEMKARFPLLGVPDKVVVISMGVDTTRYKRTHKWGKSGDRLHLCTVARLNRCKGHAYVLEAVAMLRERGMNVQYTIVGDGPARVELERQIQETGLGDRVALLGPLGEERVVEVLERTDVFVLASIAEPLGVALMEAMAMEIPVVATRAGGVAELVDDGISGFLVPSRNAHALAEAVNHLARDPHLRHRMGQAGRARVARDFDSRVCARRLFERFLAVHCRVGAQAGTTPSA